MNMKSLHLKFKRHPWSLHICPASPYAWHKEQAEVFCKFLGILTQLRVFTKQKRCVQMWKGRIEVSWLLNVCNCSLNSTHWMEVPYYLGPTFFSFVCDPQADSNKFLSSIFLRSSSKFTTDNRQRTDSCCFWLTVALCEAIFSKLQSTISCCCFTAVLY